MTTRQYLDEILQGLPEHQLRELLDFARFLGWQEDRESWQEFGRGQLARAYGPDEPEYTLDDVKSKLQS